jgi:hypothetical protein
MLRVRWTKRRARRKGEVARLPVINAWSAPRLDCASWGRKMRREAPWAIIHGRRTGARDLGQDVVCAAHSLTDSGSLAQDRGHRLAGQGVFSTSIRPA